MDINVKDFLVLMFCRIPFLILGVLVGASAFFGYTKMTEVPKYSCEVTMIVNVAPNTISTSGTIKASQDLTKAYIAIMKDFSFSKTIRAAMPSDIEYTPSQIRRSMSMSAVDESQILAVQVTTNSPQKTYEIAKAIETVSPNTLRQYFDDTGKIAVLRSAEMPTNANPSNIKVNTVFGAIIGFVLTTLIIFLCQKLDKHIRREEDILSCTKYPILGTISRVE